jgi:acetylornithine/succinyldiaminopimelate/putrescine aminotransferase
LVAAATEQAGKLWHVGNLLDNEPQSLLAEAIARHGFGGRSCFAHSGSDSNEAAFKLVRLYGRRDGRDRYKVIATDRAFHGRGFAAMNATSGEKARKGYEPFLDGFSHVPYNDLAAMA